jgi:hypothetical protein
MFESDRMASSRCPSDDDDLTVDVDWDRLEKVLGRFEGAWARGERPDPEDYLAEGGVDRLALILFMASLGWAETCPKLV